MPKGLLCHIYRNGKPSDCNKLKHTDKCILIGPGIPEIFEPSEDCPAVKINKWSVFGSTVEGAFPVGETKHCMFSGDFIYTSDSRFPYNTAVKLYDRVE